MLDLGEETLPVIEGLWCRSSDVKVAAAFMSTSPSLSTSTSRPVLGRCLCFPLSTEGRLALRRGDAVFDLVSDFRLLTCDRAVSPGLLEAVLGGLTLGEGAGLDGAATGESPALWMVRA